MMTDTINRVHLIFKTHLDVGFTDYARNVVNNYFTSYIPKAIELARQMREEGKPERFCWTTGSWLIYEYLEQATTQARILMEEAINAGDICWHGLPFTTQSELMDASLFRFGLSLSQTLDKRYGKTTIAAKMTDVPGHTRAIVPLLAEAGIRFLHIGVNPASTPPEVPPVFVWRHPTGEEVMVMYHKGSYGDLMMVPGLHDAISFAHTGDNCGPQGAEDIVRVFTQLRERFPDADITASTLDAYAQALLQMKEQLPVITGEIGDTWIHGVGTDPTKVSQFRALCRLRNGWQASGKLHVDDARLTAFSRALLTIPEHTWGMDEKTHLADYEHYTTADLRAARTGEKFKAFEASWAEQRGYLMTALKALGPTIAADEARHVLTELKPTYPDTAGFTPVDPAAPIETPQFTIRFDPTTGAIISLVQKSRGREWASVEHPLGLFMYEIFSQADYDRFAAQYLINMEWCAGWAIPDFTKPGIDKTNVVHHCWYPRLAAMHLRQDENGSRYLLEMTMPEQCVRSYGAPAKLALEIDFPASVSIIGYNLQWFTKQANRLPEALWFAFKPHITNPAGWRLDKMGQRISPLEVVSKGNRKLHAVSTGVSYADDHGTLAIETMDAPLVAPGQPSLLNFDNQQPPVEHGMHFNLYNNIWGTNFPMWFEEDARFRFMVRLG